MSVSWAQSIELYFITMTTSPIVFLVSLLAVLHVMSSLRVGPVARCYRSRNTELCTFSMDEDVGGDDFDFENRNSKPLKIDDRNLERLTIGISSLVSRAAMNTVSYYMLEFNDEVNEKWMMQFTDYKNVGFVNGVWTDYIENMIKTDKIEIQVMIRAQKNLRRGKSAPEGNNVMFSYLHELEPRKIANRLITVRQDISEELLNDIGSILYEHKEVVRYVKEQTFKGKEEADRGRKMTRMQGQSNGTPLRERNYADCSHLITEVTMDIMKHNLEAERDEESVSYLHELLAAQQDAYSKKNPADKFFTYAFAPRELLEELYINGLQKGIVTRGKKSINTMSLAQTFFSVREGLAKEVINIVRSENAHNRRYYKMITDYGGFKKLDLSPAPKFTIFDLDEYIRNSGTTDINQLLESPVVLLPSKDKVMEQIEKAADVVISARPIVDEQAGAESAVNEDENKNLFGNAEESFSGPMLM